MFYKKYFIIILLLAAFLLFFHAGTRTFWMDETAVVNYYYQTGNPVNFLVNYFKVPDNHPPLYYFLVILIYNIFPIGEIGIRLVSILSGLGIVITVYYFALLLFDNKQTARLAMLLTAVSSYFILISQMARYHSLAGFLSLVFLYFFSKMVLKGYAKKDYILFILSGVGVCLTDYPHFIYIVFITNLYFFYKYIFKKERFLSLLQWFGSQFVLLLAFLPMVWLLYLRIVRQGDGGFDKTSLLGRSLANWIMDFFIHFYQFFFGENILPWNWVPFCLGSVVLLYLVFRLIKIIYKKEYHKNFLLVFYLFLATVITNTAFLNFADPRYNFIVYPKFGFVAFPLFVMVLSYLIIQLPNKFIRWLVVGLVLLVTSIGLLNFYQLKNYLNGSYFNDFREYRFVKDNANVDDYLIINGDLNQGVYSFYQNKYFNKLKPISIDNVSELLSLKKPVRVWFFSTGSDGDSIYASASAANKVPDGFKIINQYQSVPTDPILLKLKQKLLGRQSYDYKYGVFLLTN